MDDESDKEVLAAPHETQRESIVMRGRKKSARSERLSYCAIEMENHASKNSEDDLHSCGPLNKLHSAVRKLCYKECEKLLDEGDQVNGVDETDSSTALHVLAHKASHNKGDPETLLKIASLLIERGAQVDAKDSKGNTPLHIAAIEGVYALCEVLIQQAEATQKSLVNCINVKRMTALHLAVQEGQCRVAELLLGRGATPNVKDSMLWFPLHYAMDKDCVTCCRALAPFYPGDTALTKEQEPPLMVAAKKGHYIACKELSAEKLNVDYQDENNNTALHITAKKGFYKFVIFLLDLHASLEPLNTCGHTPLMSAVTKDMEKCVTVLAERGASMTTTTFEKRNVFHIAACYNAIKCMLYLLKNHDIVNLINAKDSEGLTPLFIAVQKKNKYLKLLKDTGASPLVENAMKDYKGSLVLQELLLQENNVNITNENNMTPLHIAAREGSIEACKTLLRKDARIDACDKDGLTPLHWASDCGHENTLRFLLKKGASKRAKDHKQFTALHWAAFSGKLACCKVLLHIDRGLIKELNKEDKYALDIAFEQERFDVFVYLLEYFSHASMIIPEDLTKRFHVYVHRMMRDKKKMLLEAVIQTNWWEAGFGATEMHGDHPCPLFQDVIKVFPDLACNIMDKSYSRQNFRLLEDNYYVQKSRNTLDASSCSGSPQHIKQDEGDPIPTVVRPELYWQQHHPVSLMAARGSLPLLKHPLVEAWLAFKWNTYARGIFLIIIATQVFSIALLISLLYCLKHSQWLREAGEEGSPPSAAAPPVLLGSMFVAFLLRLCVDANSLYRRGAGNKDVYARLPSLVGLALTLVTFILACSCGHTCDDKVHMVGITALVVEGLHLICVIDKLPFINILTSITPRFICKYLMGVACATCIVILSAFIFHLLLWKEKNFETMSKSILSLVFWHLGDFEQEMFFKSKAFVHILFIAYVFTFGALVITMIKAPLITSDVNLLNKETDMINLLLEIDFSFPCLRKVCYGNKLGVKNKPGIWCGVKERLALRKSSDEKEKEEDEIVLMMSNKSQGSTML